VANEPENFGSVCLLNDLEPSVTKGGQGIGHISKDLDWLVAIVDYCRLEWAIILDLSVKLLNVGTRHQLTQQL